MQLDSERVLELLRTLARLYELRGQDERAAGARECAAQVAILVETQRGVA